MKPLRLTLQAFGPYAGRQNVDFRAAIDSGLFGIYGSTGSGKSTIFSAMTFALFGEATNKDQIANTLRSDHADTGLMTEVELVLELGDKHYRIVRRPEQIRLARRGGGETEEKHKAWLFDVTGLPLDALGDANPGKIIAEGKVTLVDAKVQELLGYKAEQFRQIVLLPQGKFETFLTAKTDDRLKILRDLFDVSLYRRLAEKLKEDARAAEDEIRTARAVCDGRLRADGFDNRDTLASGIEAATARHTALTKTALAAKSKLDAEEKSFQAAAKTDAAFVEHLDAEQALRDLEFHRAPIAALRARLAGARIVQSLVDADGAVAGARKSADLTATLHADFVAAHRIAAGATANAAATLKALDDRTDAVEALRAQRRDLRDHQKRLASSEALRTNLDNAESQARAAIEASQMARDHHAALATRHQHSVAALVAARDADSSRAALTLQASAAEAAFKVAQTYEATSDALRQARLELTEAETAHADAKSQLVRAAEACRIAEAALLADHAQHLANTLAPGAPCPVCGSPDHPRPAHATPETSARSAAHEQARSALDDATKRESVAAKRLASAQTLTRERASQLAALPGPEQSARALQDIVAASKSRIDALGARADLAAMAEAVRNLDATIADAATAAEQARDRASRQQTALALARQSLDDALQSVPLDLRQPAALQAAAKQRDDEIGNFDAALAAARAADQTAREALVGTGRDEANAGKNKRDARAQLEAAEAALGARLSQHGLSLEAYAAHKLDIPRIGEVETAIADYVQKLAIAEDRARKAAAAINDAARPELALFSTARDAADAAHTEANQQAIAAGEHVKRLTDLQASIAAETARLDSLEQGTAPLRELARTFSGQSATRVDLETFAITTMFDAVLDAANLRLGPMTRGRYTLVRETEGRGGARRGLGIGVEDTFTGRQRPASTLSGGETFIAALALALGLSEIVESRRGNVRLDTIFIDEGFGSLDSDGDAGTLEQVLQTLQDLIGRSRAVGLISHVPLVQQAIPNGFWITKSSSGSRIETRD